MLILGSKYVQTFSEIEKPGDTENQQLQSAVYRHTGTFKPDSSQKYVNRKLLHHGCISDITGQFD